MITFNKEINRYKKLRTKSKLLRADIEFLKKCKKSGIFPAFVLHRIQSNSTSELTRRVVRDARMRLLKLEIKHHYARLDIMKREQYHLHLFLLDKIHNVVWLSIEENMRDMIEAKVEWETVKQLKNKECVFLEPDKGKGVVIMDKAAYQAALNHLNTPEFQDVKTRRQFPVDTLQEEVKEGLKQLVAQGLLNRREALLGWVDPLNPNACGLGLKNWVF
jgi:hypothetical protein